ncbi:molybdopterin oxidoreductase family protein [Psychrobacter maritimus]|jgi:anaerobic selenocysteine-containing dehydrogenase|uniref:molybdopterin oxidoreductase family protein n=1 Tax=Psychrobacter maritimus TaxID=256325 RepID=UPI00248A978F|nr:molybdopterin oxidoreductase family protein [Psychrobacter sp. WB2]WGV12746.1 molybdopterin oxidoreductase family protein [Psychrobacter sp. WB2]
MASEQSKTNEQTHFRTCNLCEAMCGIEIKHDGEKVLSIKGDKNDPFSKGYICPKATALQDLHEDCDRLRHPVERTANGWKEISWPEALDKVAAGIQSVQKKHGQNAFGIYLGNPNVHNLGGMLTIKHLLSSIKTRSRFSATSIDQLPHHIVSMHLFGHMLRIPVPDVNRTQYMLIIGGNPLASNGSIMTAPNMRQKLKDIKARDGKVVVIDPRRTETADIASEHHFIRPATDVLLLLAMLNEIYLQGYADKARAKNNRAAALAPEIERIADFAKDYSAESVADITGIAASEIKRLVKEFCEAESSVCYGRMGVSVQEFGLLSQYLIMVINIVTGRLDEVGGLMFPNPAVDVVNNSGPGYLGKRHSRVSNLPDFNGDYPVVAMADEMLVEGAGQLKGFMTVAGNPVLSTPNGEKLDTAFANLDFMVAIDYFVTETSRHAHIILPPVSPLERDHYDVTFNNFAVHNVAKYSKALFAKKKIAKHDWQIYLELAKRLDKKAALATKIERRIVRTLGPKFMLDQGLRRGPYAGMTLNKLKKNPHGIDLGPLKRMLPQALKHKDKQIHLNIDFYQADLERVREMMQNYDDKQVLLIGRRHVRSNNSWLHNSYRLVKGKPRCTLMLHPETAKEYGIEDGQNVKVTSRVGSVTIVAEVTDELMPKVVSIPHGWGHGRKGVKQKIAQAHAGVSVNDLTDDTLIDQLSGNAAVNGVPVQLEAIPLEVANLEITDSSVDSDVNADIKSGSAA